MADISPTTATSTFTDVANARAKVWKETFKRFASTADVLSPLEGPEGSGASISVRNDLKGRRGDRIEFTASSELGEFGQLGEGILKGNEESLKFSGTTCTLEFKRHATALTESLKKKMAGGHTLESLSAEVLGNHFGQWKQRDALRRLIDGVRGSGTTAKQLTDSIDQALIGNDKNTMNDLVSTDSLSADRITDIVTTAAWNGVEPARISNNGYQSSQDTHHYCLLADSQLLRPVFRSSAYLNQVSNTPNGQQNVLHNGQMKDYDGTKILNMRSSYGDVDGPIGSPLAPAARIHTAGTGADNFILKGRQYNASPTGLPKYFIDFPGFDYQYTEEQSASNDNNTYYVLIVNPSGTFTFASYGDGDNNGNSITLSSDPSDNTPVTGTTVDNNAGVFNGLLSDTIETGALAFPANKHGQPIAYSLLMGSDALIRAYGEEMSLKTDSDDYGFRKGIGYQAMFGDNVWTDRNDRVRNYVLGIHAYNPIGSGLPTITGS